MPADPKGLRDASGVRKMPTQKISGSVIKQNDKVIIMRPKNPYKLVLILFLKDSEYHSEVHESHVLANDFGWCVVIISS